MVKKQVRYTKPELFHFRADSAVNAITTCDAGTGVSNCSNGSCIVESYCNGGSSAQACANGSETCVMPGADPKCYVSCSTGGSPSYPVKCSVGYEAGWDCSIGNAASFICYGCGMWKNTCP